MKSATTILETLQNNLAEAERGDPTACYDSSVETLHATLVLVGLGKADRASVEETLADLMKRW